MGPSLFLLCLASLLNLLDGAYHGVVTSFTTTPSGPVPPGTAMRFECQATGREAYWRVNGTTFTLSSSGYNISHSVSSGPAPYTWSITLSTVVTIQKNYTEISCYVVGNVANQAAEESSRIYVAGPPLPPRPNLEVESNGTVLQVTWDSPFSPSGFNITSYNLTIHNASSSIPTTTTVTVMESLIYDIINPMNTSSSCHDLNITLRAVNTIGQSNEGFVKGGFPIIPRVNDIAMEVEVVFMVNGNPRITIQFQVPVVCSFQPPADYILVIVDKNGHEVNSSGWKPAYSSTGMIIEIFVSGIHQNNTYTAELTFSHGQVPWEVTLTTQDRIVVPAVSVVPGTSENNLKQLLIICLSSLGVGLMLVVCVVLVILIVVCGNKKRKRPTYPEHIELPLPQATFSNGDFKLEPPPKGKKNKSLAPMAFNPIYDGPTYESPGGESFKSLLGGCSVPTTPMTDSPRYFNPPPTLPPPRKASISQKPNLPQGIPEEHVLGIEEYTEMKPASARASTNTVCTTTTPSEKPYSTTNVYDVVNGEHTGLKN